MVSYDPTLGFALGGPVGAAFGGNTNAGNVLTGGLTDQPDWNPEQLNQSTTDLINQMASEGNLTPQQIAARQMAGTSATMPSATGGAVAQQQNTLGGAGSGDAVTKALSDRANRLYSSQYNQLNAQAIAGAPAQQGRLQEAGANALQQQQNVADQLNRMQMQVTQQKNAMRNQVISQIFGGAGAMAGGYFGGKQASALDSIAYPQNSNGQGVEPGYGGYGSPDQQNSEQYQQDSMGIQNNRTGFEPGYGGYGSPMANQQANGFNQPLTYQGPG